MIGVRGILTRVAPGDVHLTSGQINHHGINGFPSVQRIAGIHRVITDRVGVIDMVSQNGLQTLDIVLVLAFDQMQGAELAYTRADQVFRFPLNFLHGWR